MPDHEEDDHHEEENEEDEEEEEDYEDEEDEEPGLSENTIKTIVDETLDDVEDLTDEEIKKVSGGVHVIKCNVEMEEAEEPRSADITTRFHSPVSPYFIDVQFSYWSRARYYSFEWNSSIRYKIDIDRKAPEAKKLLAANDLTTTGFKPFYEAFFDDPPEMETPEQWRRIETKSFDIDESDANAFHEALFGDGELSRKISKAMTFRLLLASVGIKFRVAEKEEEKEDGYPSQFYELSFTVSQEKAWMAVQIRRVCGVSLLRDKDFQDFEDEPPHETFDSDSGGEDYAF